MLHMLVEEQPACLAVVQPVAVVGRVHNQVLEVVVLGRVPSLVLEVHSLAWLVLGLHILVEAEVDRNQAVVGHSQAEVDRNLVVVVVVDNRVVVVP